MSIGSLYQRFVRTSPGISGYFLLLIAVVLNVAVQGFSFFTGWNFSSVFSGNAPLVIVSMAQMIAILVGGIDLSVGSSMCLANTLIVVLTNKQGWPTVTAWLAALAACTLVGLLNGTIIAFIRIPPILTTLATMSIVGGLALIVQQRPGGTVPQEVYSRYGGFTAGLPTTFWVILAVILIWFLVGRYPLGRHIRSVGGNERSAYACGVRTPLVKLSAYALAGFYTGIAGICVTCLTATGDPRIGLPFTLNSIAGAVLGGTVFGAGWGSIGGVAAGGFFLALVNNIVFFAFYAVISLFADFTPSPYMQNLLSATIIVLALASTAVTYRRQELAQRRQKTEFQEALHAGQG